MESTGGYDRGRRLTTETKSSVKTSEFVAYVLVALGILIAAAVISSGDGGPGGADFFQADKAWLYVTILTVGYMISRGLAKAGTQDPYWDSPTGGAQGGIGDRVRTAAHVLTDGPDAAHQSGTDSTAPPAGTGAPTRRL